MIDVEISDNIQQSMKYLESAPQKVRRAFSAALNRTAAGVRTEAVKAARSTYEIRAADVRQTIRFTRASAKDTSLELSSKGGNIPLIRFNVKPKNPPKKQPRVLKASVKKGGGVKPIRGAFVTRIGGHVGVLTRIGRKRLPIKELYGPAVPQMLGEIGVKEHIEKEAERRLLERFDHELKRALGGGQE
ncbi:phage tail protein [Tumebacillus permanentifrigoris]|uniref:Minor tail protein Z (GPZ) n=1 Tax=Tumebacillus permanentifrigoris TaxID=378543 RepID=A0A316DEC5_9BACL|nr:phage tail protein [Tumebacillus permanentifrigoris]PWK16066.1 minor tail protein Z (GPZ) [Tumebacillus permanentifrigoris]